MGSLSPQAQPSRYPTENPFAHYRIYTSFSSKDPISNRDMSNWIECYNPSNNTWHQVGRIPGLLENNVRKGFSMVSLGESVYIIGGRLCHKELGYHDPADIMEVDLEVLSSVLRYDASRDAWFKCAPLRVPRFDFACTVYGGKIYVAGGKTTLTSQRGVASAEVYDPALDMWEALPNMSTLRYKCVGVTWQGKIHVVGGFAERVDSDRMTPWDTTAARSSAEVFDTDNGRWDLMLGMWQLDVPPNQIAAVGEKLFSSGDCLNAWKGHVEAYDGKIWNEVDGSHLDTLFSPVSTSESWPPGQRVYLTMAAIGAHLYFLVGYKMPGEISRLISIAHVFDTSSNGWTSFEPMAEEGEKELCSHGCVVRLGEAS